jgi:hypothetical protein
MNNIENNPVDNDIYDSIYNKDRTEIKPEYKKDDFFFQSSNSNLKSSSVMTIRSNRSYDTNSGTNRKTYTQNIVEKYKNSKRKENDMNYIRTNIPTTALRINFQDEINKKTVKNEKKKNEKNKNENEIEKNKIFEKNVEETLFVPPYSGISNNKKDMDSFCSADSIDLYLNTSGPIWDVAYAPNINNSTLNINNPTTKINNSTTNINNSTTPSSIPTPSSSTSESLLNKYLAVATSRIGYPDKSSGLETLSGSYGM